MAEGVVENLSKGYKIRNIPSKNEKNEQNDRNFWYLLKYYGKYSELSNRCEVFLILFGNNVPTAHLVQLHSEHLKFMFSKKAIKYYKIFTANSTITK